MNTKEAQEKITIAMKEDAELIIEKAIAFKPEIAGIVEAARKTSGPIIGVAAIALKNALHGDNNEATQANMIKFAESI